MHVEKVPVCSLPHVCLLNAIVRVFFMTWLFGKSILLSFICSTSHSAQLVSLSGCSQLDYSGRSGL